MTRRLIMEDSCVWIQVDEGIFETDCGKVCDFLMEGDPVDNEMNHCCYCGLPLKMGEMLN
jgi:hypothetical protein